MGPTWVLSAPDGPRVGPMNLAIRDSCRWHGNAMSHATSYHGMTKLTRNIPVSTATRLNLRLQISLATRRWTDNYQNGGWYDEWYIHLHFQHIYFPQETPYMFHLNSMMKHKIVNSPPLIKWNNAFYNRSINTARESYFMYYSKVYWTVLCWKIFLVWFKFHRDLLVSVPLAIRQQLYHVMTSRKLGNGDSIH